MNKNFLDLLNRLKSKEKNFYYVEYPLKNKVGKDLKEKQKERDNNEQQKNIIG